MTLSASLDGVLEQLQNCLLDLERQEKRAISLFKKREMEMAMKLEESKTDEDGEVYRSLKEIEVIDRLQNDTLKIISDNNKNRLDLIKLYASSVLNPKGNNTTDDSENGKNDKPITQKDLDFIRQQLNKNDFKFK